MIRKPRGIPMNGQEFRQRRLRLGLRIKDMARLVDCRPQSIANLESVAGGTPHKPNRQLVRLLQVAEAPGGLALLERVAAHTAGAALTTPDPIVPSDDKEVTLLAEAIVGDILVVIQQAYPSAWHDIANNLRGIVTKQLLWIVRKVLSGEEGRAVLARRAAINARRTAGKNGKGPKKSLQSSPT